MSDRPLDPVLIATGTKEDYNPVNVEFPLPVKSYAAIIEPVWYYAAAAGGINNTNSVTLAPAVPGKRNFICSLQVANMANQATEVVVKSNNTVLWRDNLVAESGQVHVELQVNFGNPLPSEVGQALTFSCVTAGAKVYINAQGYTGD